MLRSTEKELAEGAELRGYNADIICGGFPCQDISVGGKRTGIAGRRSSLWKYLCEAIRVVQPKYAIVENVAALRRRGLETVCGDLATFGYDTEWHCIPASRLGALHERDRIWVISYPNCGDARNAPILQPHHLEKWPPKKGTQNWQNLLDELGARDVAQRADTYSGAMRILDGIPNRSHKLKALGNSLYPKIPEIIGQAIVAREESVAQQKEDQQDKPL